MEPPMRIRNRHRSSPFVFTFPDAPSTVEPSFPDALISNTPAVLLKSLTESSAAPIVSNHQHHYIESQSNLPTTNPDMAGVLMQTPPFPAIPNKEEAEELEKLRVCTVNKSRWDVSSFVQDFLAKPTSEPDQQSMQNNSNSERNKKEKIKGPLIPNPVSATKVQVHVEDDDDFNKSEIGRLEYKREAAVETNTLSCGKMSQVTEEEQTLESELLIVFSEEVAGLTAREAGSKHMLRNVKNIISEGLPLTLQVRRAMLNSPYFVLWENFRNSRVGSLDKKERTSLEIEKIMGTHKFDREEKPARELGLELAVPKIMITKEKRSRRVRVYEKEEIGSCKENGKRMKQKVEQRSYDSAYSGNNGGSNNYSWDKDAVVSSDSQCYNSQSISDGNGEASQNVLPPWDEDERYRAVVYTLFSRFSRNIGI